MNSSKSRKWICLIAAAALGVVTPGVLAAHEIQTAQTAHQPPATARKPLPVTDLKSALEQTAAVVEGVVTDIQYDYSEEDGPWTRVTLSDVQSHFGSMPQTVEIRHFGGPLPNGKLLVAAELPVFLQGKRYLVFLRNTAWNVSPVVGDLALRVETVAGTEVLVSSEGHAVAAVRPEGIDFGPALFEVPDMNGAPPKALDKSLPALDHKLLDRQSFVEALGATLETRGMQVGGTFYDRPAGEFKWRAQRTAPPSSNPN